MYGGGVEVRGPKVALGQKLEMATLISKYLNEDIKTYVAGLPGTPHTKLDTVVVYMGTEETKGCEDTRADLVYLQNEDMETWVLNNVVPYVEYGVALPNIL